LQIQSPGTGVANENCTELWFFFNQSPHIIDGESAHLLMWLICIEHSHKMKQQNPASLSNIFVSEPNAFSIFLAWLPSSWHF
jgi:hypothetical protein